MARRFSGPAKLAGALTRSMRPSVVVVVEEEEEEEEGARLGGQPGDRCQVAGPLGRDHQLGAGAVQEVADRAVELEPAVVDHHQPGQAVCRTSIHAYSFLPS